MWETVLLCGHHDEDTQLLHRILISWFWKILLFPICHGLFWLYQQNHHQGLYIRHKSHHILLLLQQRLYLTHRYEIFLRCIYYIIYFTKTHLKHHGEHGKWQWNQYRNHVLPAIHKQLVIRAKKMTQWIQKNKTENCQNDTKPECHRHQQWENFPRFQTSSVFTQRATKIPSTVVYRFPIISPLYSYLFLVHFSLPSPEEYPQIWSVPQPPLPTPHHPAYR